MDRLYQKPIEKSAEDYQFTIGMPRPNLTDGFNRKMKRFAIPDLTALNKSSSICLNQNSTSNVSTITYHKK